MVAKADITRDALMSAGLSLFGRYGFEATSTRMLAKESGANVSAIMYHFSNKEGLYCAVIEQIVSEVGSHLKETVVEIQAMLAKPKPTAAEARLACSTLIHSMAELFVATDKPTAWAQVVIREQASPTPAFDILYDGQIKQVQQLLSRLISLATGLSEESTEVKLRGHALFGQVLVFTVSRESLLRQLGIKKLGTEHIHLISDILCAHTNACLSTAISPTPLPSAP